MKKIIITISILILISLIGGTFYYILGTPKYSLHKLTVAVENHDSVGFNKYVDAERVSRSLIEDVSRESLSGELLIQFTKEKVQSEINKLVENPSDEINVETEGIRVKEIKKNGKTAKVVLENNKKEILNVDMIQTSDRYWKIVKVDATDLMKTCQKVTVNIIVSDLDSLNSQEFKKKILGKNEEQLREILKTYAQIKEANIEYYPSYLSGEIPENGDRVEIKIKLEDKKAKGKVTFYNEYSPNSQSLVATTRLLSEDGKLFRLVDDVTIPGFKKTTEGIEAGIIEADVIASEFGEEYIIGPSTFSIPGFKETNEEKYLKLYAKSEENMTEEY
jgi:hypothetical protein